jgi:translation initiation factor IF-2
MAEKENVDIQLYRVIYNIIEDVQKAMEGMLDPEFKEVIVGRAEVRAVYKVPKVGNIAGCYLVEGKINRNNEIRLLRDNIVIHEGKIDSLKRFKDDVREVAEGFECGLGIANFNDIKEGDMIEAFLMEEIKRK